MPAEPGAYPAAFEVEDAFAANELFHRNGWTDGLPIVPPTFGDDATHIGEVCQSIRRAEHSCSEQRGEIRAVPSDEATDGIEVSQRPSGPPYLSH